MKQAGKQAAGRGLAQFWRELSPRLFPFADAATAELPLGRLIRLSLFQVTVGMALVLLIGTLNRVMIVELGVPAGVVGVMISLPLLFAPLRSFIGHSSDNYKSVLGWRRVPYLAMGTMLQFGGLAIMPFAIIVLSGDTNAPAFVGYAAAGLAFLLTGAGLHTVQTVGLALANDLAPPRARPRVVAMLCFMLLTGMVVSAISFGLLLSHFSEFRLIQVVQGSAVVTLLLNMAAMWKQEPRNPSLTRPNRELVSFAASWARFAEAPLARRRLIALALGTAAFSLQDVLLEPYGGQILHLSVGATTALTAGLAVGGILGLWTAARQLERDGDPYRVAASGSVIGIAAFAAVIFSSPLHSAGLFAAGVALIGFGAGQFGHATLTAAMQASRGDESGFSIGVWSAVQATAAGSAIAVGGVLRDVVSAAAVEGRLGEALNDPAVGYSVVYHLEIGLLFATLIAVGPLVRRISLARSAGSASGRPEEFAKIT